MNIDARNRDRIGVLLMTFGTASSVDDVPRYLAKVRGGTPAAALLVAEFQRRFALVGGSPLIRICEEQAAALETLLNSEARAADRYRVSIGMRHSDPTIATGLAELVAAGASRIVGLVLSPQYSDVVLAGYLRDFAEARSVLPSDIDTAIARAWHDDPSYVATLTNLVREALECLNDEEQSRIPILFTAHSLPLSMAERDPDYLIQLRNTAEAVATQVGIASERWRFVYQSAGHTREPWLTPDLVDVLPELKENGHQSVLVVPVQFVADHLEVLYDIDVAAREQAERVGMRLVRTESPNVRPDFIHALASAVHHTADAT